MFIDDFVKQEGWEEKISSAPYNVKVSRLNGYVMLKYSQIESDFSNEEVQQCRGTVFRESDMKCVCRPFNKFFNYGEPNAARIDWAAENLRVLEKIDGSLIKVWYDEVWHISTNGSINAFAAAVGGASTKSYGDLFMEYIENVGFDIYSLDRKYTHLFEVVSPLTRVVVPYEKLEVYYLTSIRTEDGAEFMDREKMEGVLPLPYELKIGSLKELVEVVSDMDWTHEGFVVWDGQNRIKVKSPAYVKAHYARNNGNVSWETLVNVVLSHEEDEFLTYAPEWGGHIEAIQEKMEDAADRAKEYRGIFNFLCDRERKDFASQVIQFVLPKYQSFLFSMYDGKVYDWGDFVKDWDSKKWVHFLELRKGW